MARFLLSLCLFSLLVTTGSNSVFAGEIDQDRQKALLRQKLTLLESLLYRSKSTESVMASDDEGAKSLIINARKQHSSAKSSLEIEDLDGAKKHADTALKMLSSATLLSKKKNRSSAADRTRYDELLRGIKFLEETAQQGLPESVTELVDQARKMAVQDNYREAARLLNQAYEEASMKIAETLDEKTVVYGLDFANPREEYQYELNRFNSSHTLVTYMRQHSKRPLSNKLVKKYTDDALQSHDEAVGNAEGDDYPGAIEKLEHANEMLQRVLRLLGAQL